MKNVLILKMARTRSSLVAHIVREYGFNAPKSYGHSHHYPKGLNENKALKRILDKERGGSFDALLNGKSFYPDFYYSDIAHTVDQPWMVKIDPFCWHIFREKNPIIIKVRRDREDTIRSNMQKNSRYNREQTEQIVDLNFNELDRIDGYEVDTDLLIAGDRTQLDTALIACGVDIG